MSIQEDEGSPHDDGRADHRAIGKRQALFSFSDEAPGMVFWHPRGLILYRLLEEASRARVAADGYEEVRTPQVMRRAVWQASGHWQHFASGMMKLQVALEDDASLESALKPVSCPGHIHIASRDVLSYRMLPLRLAELGLVHRDEPSGTLHGLLRLRQFTQDDGHVFCRASQAQAEVVRFLRGLRPFYEAFGFRDVSLALSLRPDERAGSDAQWDSAEGMLRGALDELGEQYDVQPGAGAFYGPKIELALRDRAGRSWQCGTIQLDLVMPQSFDLRYVDERGEREHVVMLHRALYGSLERFLGVLLEHHAGALPAWCSPEQIAIVPVGADLSEHARSICADLRSRGLRARVDERDESLTRRIAMAHERSVPFVVVVGRRELAARSLSVRALGRDEGARPEAEVVNDLVARCAPPRFDAV